MASAQGSVRTATIDRETDPSEKIGLILAGSDDGNFYVDRILVGLAAHKCDQLMQGDKLLHIGHHSVPGATQKDVEAWLTEDLRVVISYEREFADLSDQMLHAASSTPVPETATLKATALKKKLIARRKAAEQVMKRRGSVGSESRPTSEIPNTGDVVTLDPPIFDLPLVLKDIQIVGGMATLVVKVRYIRHYLCHFCWLRL
jgi:hypothetical protein